MLKIDTLFGFRRFPFLSFLGGRRLTSPQRSRTQARLSSLKAKFIAVITLMIGVFALQSAVGGLVAGRGRTMTMAVSQVTEQATLDLELSQRVKNMEIGVLLIQSLIGTVAVQDPVDVANQMTTIRRNFADEVAGVERIATQRGLNQAGTLTDIANRLDVARASFGGLEDTAKQILTRVKVGRDAAPADLVLKLSAQVDGLFEHLDRMAEAMKLTTTNDRAELKTVIGGNLTATTSLLTMDIATTVVGLVLCIVASVFLLLGVLRPLVRVAEATRLLANGDLSANLPPPRQDEIGAMIRSLVVFRDNAREVRLLAEEREREKTVAEETRRQAMQNMALRFEEVAGSIIASVAREAHSLVDTSRAVSRTARAASLDAASAETATAEASREMQVMAGAAEMLHVAATDVLSKVADAAGVARQAAAGAGGIAALVDHLSEASVRINEVVALINHIASQTHLLALNATIEAARAGEAGRGFAVVASEVKNLAAQTAKATESIQAEVEGMQGVIKSSVRAMQDITGHVQSIDQVNTTISETIADQARTTADINRRMAQAATRVVAIGQQVGKVAEAANDTGSATGTVFTASESLAEQAAELQKAVGEFLTQVRSN